jgi:hypothetical protein
LRFGFGDLAFDVSVEEIRFWRFGFDVLALAIWLRRSGFGAALTFRLWRFGSDDLVSTIWFCQLATTIRL